MTHASWGMVVGLMVVQFLMAGCEGGGGLASLFGGGGSGDAGTLGDLASGGVDAIGGSGGSGGGEGGLVSEVATVHSPEPASIVLFAGGLAGLAHLRRRKGRAQRTTKR